jgi:hypothetical protein
VPDPFRLGSFCISSAAPSTPYIEEPIVFLAVDTPRRDPKYINFVNPEDGTPESFVRGL